MHHLNYKQLRMDVVTLVCAALEGPIQGGRGNPDSKGMVRGNNEKPFSAINSFRKCCATAISAHFTSSGCSRLAGILSRMPNDSDKHSDSSSSYTEEADFCTTCGAKVQSLSGCL